MTLADKAWQPNRASVDKRNAETPAVHAEDRIAGGNTHIAPEGQFQAASNGVPFDGGDYWLGKQHPRASEWSIPLKSGARTASGSDGFKIGSRAEGSVRAREYGHR